MNSQDCRTDSNRSRRTAIGSLYLAVTLAALSGSIGTAGAQDEVHTIDWLTFTSPNAFTAQAFREHFLDVIEERSEGRIAFRYRGGSDTIGVFEQGAAVQSGIIGLAHPPVGFYEAQVPGVGGAVLSEVSLEQEREPGGGFEYLSELHEAAGMKYLGRAYAAENFFYVGCNTKPEAPEDFAALTIGSATATQAAVAGWGAAVVSMGTADYYPAMERGVVDCLASTPLTQLTTQAIGEVTDYVIDHGIFMNSQSAIMNLQVFEALSEDLQQIIMDVSAEYEIVSQREIYAQDLEVQKKILQDEMDTEFYTLDDDTLEWFRSSAYEATWAQQAERYPEVTEELRKRLSRQ